MTARGAASVLLSAVAVACGLPIPGQPTPSVDPLSVARACAPTGWTAGTFPPGSRDYGLGPGNEIGQIRLFLPETVANLRGRSKAGGGSFATDWWTVTEHDETSITFADGRTGKQYRSKSGGAPITTEFTTAAGTWQVYAARSEEHYADVLRCIESRLAVATR